MTLRVLHVIGAMDRGGAETMLVNLHRAIDRSRVQFDYLVHETRECDYDAEIESLGGRVFRGMPRYTIANGHAYRKRMRAFFAEHPEHRIVHGHIGSSSAIYLDEAKRAGRYTVAHSHAQNFVKGPAGMAFSAMTHPTRRIADYFMACSREAGEDRFGAQIVDGDRFTVLRTGIDLDAYRCDEAAHDSARAALGFGLSMMHGGSPVIGHVGRLAPEKNHAFLIDAFEAYLREEPRARLVCVGRGPLEDQLRAEVGRRGMDSAVAFAGVSDDVPTYLKAFDAFAFPSTSEGLAMAVVEAQASGLPVVMSTGVPELAVVSPRTERLPLDAGADAWAARLAGAVSAWGTRPRTDCTEDVRDAGFDIRDTAAWLARFYLAHAK